MKAFFTRLASGIVLLAIIILGGILGGWFLFGLTLLISVIGYLEFARVFQIHRNILGVSGIMVSIAYICLAKTGGSEEIGTLGMLVLMEAGPLLLITYLLFLFGIYVFTFPKYRTEQIMAAFFGVFYVPVMLSFIYIVRMSPMFGTAYDGMILYWLIFICSWGCDTCAYAVGVLFGKHKLAPVLSPKKSIEGAVGGVAGAALLGYLCGMCGSSSMQDRAGTLALTCAVGAVLSQIGDLTASAIKRNHGIKDYGHLIPGHGGILDRFDSVIFTAPVVFAMARLVLPIVQSY